MFCNINAFTKAGLQHNEDAVFAGNGLLIVMDGASSLGGIHLTDAPTDACWLAEETVTMLAKKLSKPAMPITQALDETAVKLRERLHTCGYPADGDAYPSGSLMIARETEGQVELFSLGDCTALIRFCDARPVLCFHDDAVTRLDGSVLAQAAALARNSGKSVAEVLPQLRNELVKNRQKRNTNSGYWIFDPSGAGISHGERMLLPVADIHSLALMSDGFHDILEVAGAPSCNQLMELLETTSAQQLINDLFAVLEADPGLDRYPRFKVKDDATVAFTRVKK